MSFVLQLGTVETPVEKKNGSSHQSSSSSSTLLSQDGSSVVVEDAGKSQILQCLEAAAPEIPSGHVISFATMKSVNLTYPVAKSAREMQRIGGSQTNTTQVLTTRVISQKLPSTGHPTLNAGPHVTHVPVNSQTLSSAGNGVAHVYPLQYAASVQSKQLHNRGQVIEGSKQQSQQQQQTVVAGLQGNVHQKTTQQQVTSQQLVTGNAVKTISTSVPNIQRIHVKTQNLVGQAQTVNLQKVKTVNANQAVAVQRNSLPRIQTVQKGQTVPTPASTNQFTVNTVNNTTAVQRGQQQAGNTNLQKAQGTQKMAQQVYNNQKVSGQVLTGHPNHKTQHQQIGNQQAGLQKLQGQQQKNLAVTRQQQTSTMNNVQKSSNSVAGIQKAQALGQVQGQQLPPVQVPKHVQQVQQVQSSSQRIPQQSTGQQKSQTLATANSNRVQGLANVGKSNSVSNIAKMQQNSNLLTGTCKQPQVISQPQQQIHVQATSSPQLQQQLLQQTPQPQQQVTGKQQGNAGQPVQRSQSMANVHQKVTAIATMPNNQRTQVANSKAQQQQQMVMRVGVQKTQGQALQQGNLKSIPQKVANTVKTSNASQNAVQQPLHRNTTSQPVKIIQQQQNVIGPQNTQKQPGCIKTIPPQKSAQRNHQQKVTGIKTSLNTNVTAVKGQGPSTAVPQKSSIKTLLPQQPVTQNMLVHKSQPIKIQQQAIQQKQQLIMTSQFPQQVRQQSGQIKTLLPVTSTEPRKEVENKIESEPRVPEEDDHQEPAPKSPVRRMPHPYEVTYCLQFVLQDHNYVAPPPRSPSPPTPPPHPKQQAINGAGSSAATSQHTYMFGQVVSGSNVEDDAASAISSEAGREVEPEGEETETAPEGEGDDEDSVTRCICDFEHDDGYMICCDRCLVWQHVDCMGIDRSNIPDEYLCEICRPRRVDRQRARALQMRKREELLNSDTSSDTSSTSSADTDVGVNAIPKKRTLPQQQQQPQQVPRRKSDPPPQVRRLNNNNNNNNNVAKRQRRDSHPRQSSAVRKKEATKRGPGKRKPKRRMSVEDKEEETQDSWSSNVAPLRQWIERYEEAVTNHYSPELRARISSIKVNGTHSDLRQSNMNVIASGKCRLNVHSNNVRFLVATMYLPPNTPVVELRGKYMLSTQHRPSHPQGRQHTQRPGPFVFFYRLPRDGTEVCVDTRTYGNDARFVRRSCKPNAEVKHCIEKGTLHLYIVTTTAIEKNAEITIRHEQHDLLLSPNPNGPMVPIVCACNNPRECQITSVNQLTRRGSNGALVENADGRERRRRGRRNTVCEDSDSSTAAPSTSVAQPTPPPVTPAPSVSPAPARRTITTTVATVTRQQTPKEEPPAPPVPQPQTSPNSTPVTVSETKKDKKKMTREERKMEAIMKAFERLEKAEQRKQEVQARNAQRKESGSTHSDNEDVAPMTLAPKQKQQGSDRPLRRKKRKGRTRTTSQSQSGSRRSRLNSADSDLSSGEESTSMQSPPLSSQNHSQTRDAPYSAHLHTPAKNTNDNATTVSAHQGIPTAAGLLLALANSNAPGPSSPPLQQPTPVKSPTCDSGASSSSQSSTPPTPLSSACLLVAAAVGPLAPGFKFPKTKKVLMNEWLKESPDPPQTNVPQISPLPALPSTPLSNSINPLCRSSDFSLPADSSAEFLSQSYAAKSLATLVQAANSVSGICDSPPQRKQTAAGNTGCPVSSGSAKKRWLRQAISEECDSPNSRPESPPASELVAPPKKRRIARESLSSDNYTPPTTPTMLHPEAVPHVRSLCPTEDDYIEHPQSPLTEPTDDRQPEPTESVKQEEPSEDKLRQKLCIEIPGQNFHAKSIKDEESLEIVPMDVLVKENSIELKVEPKEENMDCESTEHFDSKPVKDEFRLIKSEIDYQRDRVKKEHVIKEEIVQIEKGTVEIVDRNEEGDTEMEDLSSPIDAIESDAILKQRVDEMRLEFGGAITEMENDKSEDDDRKQDSVKSDDNMSIDEFDVEAQMKKITGDDGDDYKEKVDTSSEKDKSMDGIEGLMESSKEDSESEDKDLDDIKYETSFKSFSIDHEERMFKEFESKPGQEDVVDHDTKELEQTEESQKADQSSVFVASSEESIFESTSSNMDTESIAEPPKIFHSIPPLSERIRKKTEASTSKSQLNFEAAIIESTIDIISSDESKNGEQKSMLSTALRELLEAKLDDLAPEEAKEETVDENSTTFTEPKSETSEQSSVDVPDASKAAPQEAPVEEPPAKEEEVSPVKEVKRLKDPRTVVPNSMPAPAFKPDGNPPVKRKLSISEYRKRKQQSSGTPPDPEPSSNDATFTDKGSARGRSDSASSGTSSLSSDEEASKIPSLSLDLPGLTALPLFNNAETEEKKGGEEGTMGWSAAPTLVERQRENLTERLKREFGLFLSDDEEERARKQGLTAEAILKARKSSPPHPTVTSTPPGYPVPQLPPQPYIPPPGSASIHYAQFQAKPCPVQYPNFTVPQTAPQPVYANAQTSSNKQQPQQQFLVPQASQAPPGSNPYPPQFIPPTTTAVSIAKFSSGTPPSGTQMYPVAGQSQKPFYNHPAPRS
ncbi:SET domain-containing protein upSET isoform X2 [Lasioglossum baleicum]|uniref:SET domain-containing protein upSET isoform X2 n=1 Tax=Lasioglossum baleicum TaxID=434251 RepID=UPI003FCD9345